MTADLIEHIDHFQRRIVQDAITEATALYWLDRAATFEWARPRPGDRLGEAGAKGAAEVDARCKAAADACRARAAVLRGRVAA